MDEFIWTDDLITGEEVVDFQHKKIFDYLNTLIAVVKTKDAQPTIMKETLNALVEYAVLHFEDEEIVLESLGYPDLVAHQKLHGDFTKKIVDFQNRYDKGENVLAELILFIKHWLITHVKQEDMKALKYRQQK